MGIVWHHPTAEMGMLEEFSKDAEYADLANFTASLSLLWKETANAGQRRAETEWLADKAAEAFGIDKRYDHHREIHARRSDGAAELAERDTKFAALDDTIGEATIAFLKASHDEARQRCEALGVTHVPASRGMRLPRAQVEALGITVFSADDVLSGTARMCDHDTGIQQGPISSWGMGAKGASWGTSAGLDDEVKIVVRAMVPVGDIAGFGGAGFGGMVLPDGRELATELEVVILDRDRPCQVLAVETTDEPLAGFAAAVERLVSS